MRVKISYKPFRSDKTDIKIIEVSSVSKLEKNGHIYLNIDGSYYLTENDTDMIMEKLFHTGSANLTMYDETNLCIGY